MRRIVCLGGGPAGLYAAILLRKALPSVRVEVYERNRPDDTFGWGVVFSDQTMGNFRVADPETHAAILASFHHWDDIAIHFGGRRFVSGGHGFAGISRKRLLNLLQQRAQELGVQQSFQHEVADLNDFHDADLLIAADGINSRTRNNNPAIFQPDVDVRKCRFIWLGTTQKFDAFTFAFEQTEQGWFQIHAYQFSKDLSTVIVETREETWKAHGLDAANTAQSIAFCERLFGQYLDGHPLQSNANHLRGSAWLNFNRVTCRNWHHGRTVLIGDAAPHRPLFHRLGHKARHGRRHFTRQTRHRHERSRRRPGRVSQGAQRGGSQAPERPPATAWNGSRMSPGTCICPRSSLPTAC